jgi:hypothetical protein
MRHDDAPRRAHYRSLSSPFMDGSSACGFFDMILGMFIEADLAIAGKLVGDCPLPPTVDDCLTNFSVLDEAHKVCYLFVT